MRWRIPRPTDIQLLVVGLIAIVVFSLIAAVIRNTPSGSYTSIRDDTAGGARALRIWLEEIGYEVVELVDSSVEPDEVDVLVVLSPRTEYSADEAQRVMRWVRSGNVLLVAGYTYNIEHVVAPYGLEVDFAGLDFAGLSLNSPILVDPPVSGVVLGSMLSVDSDREEMVMHLSYQRRPVLVSMREGQGMVWVMGSAYPFTNYGLQDENSGRLILNLLASKPPPATIGFDEGFHNLSQRQPGLTFWLRTTPAGWSILTAVALSMTFLLARGRRFGPAIPVLEERLMREPVEYVQAIAGLLRRSGQRERTLAHYRAMLVRELARRYAIDPRIDDHGLVRLVLARDPEVDGVALLALLESLSRRRVSEADLVQSAAEVDEWIKGLQ